MASSGATFATDSGKTAPESGYGAPSSRQPPNYFGLDVVLRLFLLACLITSLVVMVTSNETKHFPTGLPAPAPPFVVRNAKFTHSPAFVYMVAALSVACLYVIVTLLASASAISNPSPSSKLLFLLVLFDAVMIGIMASATGSTGGVAYVGLKGNSHVGWTKICNRFSKFCRHLGSSAFLSMVASILLVLLVVLSSYSLYRRSR